MEPGPAEPPKYVRFLAALVLGSAAVIAPVALGACGGGSPPPPEPDAMVDASPIDSSGVVDGPLHPPDLPRRSIG